MAEIIDNLKRIEKRITSQNRRAVVQISIELNIQESSELKVQLSRMLRRNIIIIIAQPINFGVEDECECCWLPSELNGLIFVGSIDQTSNISLYLEKECADIYAPGENIRTTLAFTDSFIDIQGTSAAAAHVTGVVASLLSLSFPPFVQSSSGVYDYLFRIGTKLYDDSKEVSRLILYNGGTFDLKQINETQMSDAYIHKIKAHMQNRQSKQPKNILLNRVKNPHYFSELEQPIHLSGNQDTTTSISLGSNEDALLHSTLKSSTSPVNRPTRKRKSLENRKIPCSNKTKTRIMSNSSQDYVNQCLQLQKQNLLSMNDESIHDYEKRVKSLDKKSPDFCSIKAMQIVLNEFFIEKQGNKEMMDELNVHSQHQKSERIRCKKRVTSKQECDRQRNVERKEKKEDIIAKWTQLHKLGLNDRNIPSTRREIVPFNNEEFWLVDGLTTENEDRPPSSVANNEENSDLDSELFNVFDKEIINEESELKSNFPFEFMACFDEEDIGITNYGNEDFKDYDIRAYDTEEMDALIADYMLD